VIFLWKRRAKIEKNSNSPVKWRVRERVCVIEREREHHIASAFSLPSQFANTKFKIQNYPAFVSVPILVSSVRIIYRVCCCVFLRWRKREGERARAERSSRRSSKEVQVRRRSAQSEAQISKKRKREPTKGSSARILHFFQVCVCLCALVNSTNNCSWHYINTKTIGFHDPNTK